MGLRVHDAATLAARIGRRQGAPRGGSKDSPGKLLTIAMAVGTWKDFSFHPWFHWAEKDGSEEPSCRDTFCRTRFFSVFPWPIDLGNTSPNPTLGVGPFAGGSFGGQIVQLGANDFDGLRRRADVAIARDFRAFVDAETEKEFSAVHIVSV
jgi:hypothetical protein